MALYLSGFDSKILPGLNMQSLYTLIDKINETIGRFVSWAALFMVLITLVIVILRYFFDTGWIAMQESVVYLHAALFMMGAAYTLKHDGHVRVDIFYGKMSTRGQSWVNLFGAIVLLLPVCLLILIDSWEYVTDAWHVMEGSREAGGIPGVYLLKSLIPMFSRLMILQGVSESLKAIEILKNKGLSHG